MLIANPIYDVVFKRMMENERVAKFFIGTLLGEEIEAIEIKPQEYTYEGELDLNDPQQLAILENRIKQRYSIWIYRLDFIATIRTASGELKKVLVEIQKAKNQLDLMRFRNYLAEQYKKEDTVNNQKVILPITTIYILGFNLPEIQTPCIKVERNYKDLVNAKIITAKSDFVEKLTHDSFIVQVNRITNSYSTTLEKLLSLFEQQNFSDDKKITKEFTHELDSDEIKFTTDILHFAGTNPEARKKIETEQEAWRTINVVLENTQKELDETNKALDESHKSLDESHRVLDESHRVLDEKDKALDEKDKLIEDLLKKLNEKK